MPKSKRDKKISLTKTSRKGHELKQKIIDDVNKCVEKFKSIYIFTYRNMRNDKMKEIREDWKPSRFMFGKNRVIAVAFGRSEQEEIAQDLHKLVPHLKGQCGLLFTDVGKKEVLQGLKDVLYEDYARSGFKATKTIKLDEGPLPQFQHSMEPYLRQLGMPTKLERGVVTLRKEFQVCKKGDVLTPEQAKILELLDIKLALGKLKVVAGWSKSKGYIKIKQEKDDEEEAEEEQNDNEDNDLEEMET